MFFFSSSPLCCFNQWEAGVADLYSIASAYTTTTTNPPTLAFSQSVWKIHVIWLPPPPLVLIREECSGSSGSRVLSFPLTTVRPDSTLIALTPRHIPVQSLVTEFGYKRRAKGQNKLIFVPLIQNVLKLLTHICNDEARLEARSADTLNRMFQITNHRCFVIFFFNIFLCSALRTLKALWKSLLSLLKLFYFTLKQTCLSRAGW